MDVVVYDTTLRDGMQGEGMSLSVEEKVRVARILDELGVPMIEAGFPTSNPKELELFERLREAGLRADGYGDDPGYAVECLRAAMQGGAENLTMCDTNGASLPQQVAEAVQSVRIAL